MIIEVLLFGSAVVLARMIPPAAFGIFAVIIIVQELAVTMPLEGVGGALVQRAKLTREHLQAGLALTVLTGLVMAALTVAVAIFIVRPLFDHQTEILVIAQAPYFLMGAIYAVPIAVLRRRLDFRRVSIVETLQNASRVIATIGLALLGLDAPALVFGCTVGMAVGLVAALFFAPVPLPRWRGKEVRDLLPYGGPAALATFAWTGFRNGDYAVIGSVLGPAAAGLYWRGYQLAVEYQGKVAVPMAQMAFPVLARSEDTKEMLALRRRMVHLQTVVIFPLLVALLVLAPTVVPWLFGSDWEGAVLPTQILVAGGAASLVINAAGSALMAEGRAKALLGYGVAHFVVYVGAVVAVAHLGLAGGRDRRLDRPRHLPRRRLRRPARPSRRQPADGALARPRPGADRLDRDGRGGGAARAGDAPRGRAGPGADGRGRAGRRGRLRRPPAALLPGRRPRPARRPAAGRAGSLQHSSRPRWHPGRSGGMSAGARILLVSPVFNEEANLESTARALVAQELPPARWVVVDDGSRDGTLSLARRLAAEIDFMEVIEAAATVGPGVDNLALAREARAFNLGLEYAGWRDYELIGKLDGDVELPPEWLATLARRFAADPRLGLAGGRLVEADGEGGWRRIEIPSHHIHGAVKLFRRECLEAIGGIPERLGWDTIDETYARMHDWGTRSFDDLVARHHRPWGSADGRLRGCARHGECAWILHYDPLWVTLRSAKVGRSSPPVASGIAFLYGYWRSALRRVPRVEDPEFRRFTRRELRGRMRAALGGSHRFGGRRKIGAAEPLLPQEPHT